MSSPGSEVRYRAWCVLKDGRVAYIDHYKTDGKFGVRPVDFNSGLHFANTSPHWPQAKRMEIPEEHALALHEFRAAADDELPPMYRRKL